MTAAGADAINGVGPNPSLSVILPFEASLFLFLPHLPHALWVNPRGNQRAIDYPAMVAIITAGWR